MGDRGEILAGSIVFLALVLSPVWYNAVSGGGAPPAPDLAPAREQARALYGKEICVRPADVMRSQHPQFLITWRDQVVREGVRFMVDDQGRRFRMSLTQGCLSCHANKAEFCDRCHVSAGVTPKCFDCHQEKFRDPAGQRLTITDKNRVGLLPGETQTIFYGHTVEVGCSDTVTRLCNENLGLKCDGGIR